MQALDKPLFDSIFFIIFQQPTLNNTCFITFYYSGKPGFPTTA